MGLFPWPLRTWSRESDCFANLCLRSCYPTRSPSRALCVGAPSLRSLPRHVHAHTPDTGALTISSPLWEGFGCGGQVRRRLLLRSSPWMPILASSPCDAAAETMVSSIFFFEGSLVAAQQPESDQESCELNFTSATARPRVGLGLTCWSFLLQLRNHLPVSGSPCVASLNPTVERDMRCPLCYFRRPVAWVAPLTSDRHELATSLWADRLDHARVGCHSGG